MFLYRNFKNNLFRVFLFIFVLFSILKLYIIHIGSILDSPISLGILHFGHFAAFRFLLLKE